MAVTQVKDASSDAQLKIMPDGSINVNGGGGGGGNTNANIEGLNAFQTSQYIIGVTAVQVAPTPLVNRSSVSFRVEADRGIPIYVGNNSSVTISTGYPLYDGDTLSMDLTPTDTIYAISTAANQVLAILEIA